MDSFRQEKIQRFEEFVDCRLKPDLVKAISERDRVFEQQKVFTDLRRNIENLEKNSVTSLRTLVNLGSEVYMQADVYAFNFSSILVSRSSTLLEYRDPLFSNYSNFIVHIYSNN